MAAGEEERRRPTKKGTTPEVPPPPAPEQDSRVVMLTEKLKQHEAQAQAFKALEEVLVVEVNKLREDCRSLKRDRLQVTAVLQAAADTAAAEAAALREALQARDARIACINDECAQKEAEMVATAAAEQAALQKRLAAAATALEGLVEIRRRREELEEATKQAQQENVRLTQEYEVKLGALHLRAHKAEQRVEALEREAAEQAAAAGATDESEADPFKLLRQNRKLAAALRRADEEAAALRSRVDALTAELVAAKTELAVAIDVESKAIASSAGHAKREGAAQELVAVLRSEVAAAQAATAEAVAEREGLKHALAAAKQEVESAKRQAARQARETRQAREAARALAAERSEAQAFLVSSIRAVRREIAALNGSESIRDNKGRARFVAGTPTSLPVGVGSASPAASLASTSSGRSSAIAAAASLNQRLGGSGGRLADVGELSWEEREAVLRLLLAQINGSPAVSGAREIFAEGATSVEATPADAAALETAAGVVTMSVIADDDAQLPEMGSPVPFAAE